MFEDKQKDRKVEDILKEIEKEFGKGKKVEDDIWKGLESLEEKKDIEKGIDGFWNVVEKKEEGNANCRGNDAKSTNGKKRRQKWILEEIETR